MSSKFRIKKNYLSFHKTILYLIIKTTTTKQKNQIKYKKNLSLKLIFRNAKIR